MHMYFVSLHQVLPFILVGIGVDVSQEKSVTVAHLLEFQRHKVAPHGKENLKALEKCGMTVTLTSLTNVVVFLFGATFSYPAVQYFCIYAAMAIFFNYVLQCTLFTAFLVKDLQRQEKRLQDGM
ncbi:unnamed protein product, partial [Amoebophrya sp. A120]|eukprot:GSA120T00026182001.1